MPGFPWGRRGGVAAAGWNTLVAAANPVEWWKMDQGALGNGATVTSSAVGGHAGTTVGAMGSHSPGLITGNASGLDTDNGAGNGYFTFTEITLGAAWTIEGVVSIPTLPGGGGYQMAILGDGGAPIALWMLGDKFGLSFDGSTSIVQSATFAVNTIYYVAVTYDGVNLRMYVNGSLVSGPTADSNVWKFKYVGFSGVSSVLAFRIEEVAIYATARSTADIAAQWAVR